MTAATDRIANLAKAAGTTLLQLVAAGEQADAAVAAVHRALEAAITKCNEAEAAAETEANVVRDLLDAAGIDRTNRVEIARTLGWSYGDPPYDDTDSRILRILEQLRRDP